MAVNVDLKFIKAAVNPNRLAAELTVAIGAVFVELLIGGTEPGELHVMVTPAITAEQTLLVGQVVAAHDAYYQEPEPTPDPEPEPEPVSQTIDLVFEKDQVNAAKLHEELATIPGFVGVSTGRGTQVRVHMKADQVTPGIEDVIMPLIDVHDASQLTADQQAELDRLALADSLRKPWAEWIEQDKDDLLRLLADQANLL